MLCQICIYHFFLLWCHRFSTACQCNTMAHGLSLHSINNLKNISRCCHKVIWFILFIQFCNYIRIWIRTKNFFQSKSQRHMHIQTKSYCKKRRHECKDRFTCFEFQSGITILKSHCINIIICQNYSFGFSGCTTCVNQNCRLIIFP